jgi:glycosyltransferase involved in cell wall biosynthesis
MTRTGGPEPTATLVLPTYNAAAFIADTVERLARFLERHPDWRVLFVCDGCTDATPGLLGEACARTPGMEVRIHGVNRGKGHAIRSGFDAAATPHLVFTDVDLAYDPEDACRIVALLQAGADLAVADRARPDSRHWVSPRDFPSLYRRHVMSRLYNAWVRRMLPIAARDTQAGLKGIRLAAWQRLAPALRVDGFAFDVELLARAGQAGMTIVETPVSFRYVDPTSVVMLRHGWAMLFAVLRLRRALRQRPLRAPASAPSLPGPDRA